MRIFSWFNTDIPFANDALHRSLPFVIALMLALTTTLSLAAYDMYRHISRHLAVNEQIAYIEIPNSVNQNRTDRDALLAEVAALLEAYPGLGTPTSIDRDEIETLLSPWLGDVAVIDTLPLPQLIEVPITVPREAFDEETFIRSMGRIDADIRIDLDEAWREQFHETTALVMTTLLTIALMLCLTAIAVVTLMARMGLQLHHKAVELLHLMGAYDRYIVRQFQRYACKLACKGALIGAVLGVVLYYALALIEHSSEVNRLLSFAPQWSHATLLLGFPLWITVCSYLTTQLVIGRQLKQRY